MQDEIEALRDHLDAVAGAQLAMMTALSVTLTPYKKNPQALEALRHALEDIRAGLLASSASDRKIHHFDEVAETLLESLS